MNKAVKVGLFLSAMGLAAWLIISGKDKVAELANGFTFKITGLGKPVLKNAQLTIPVNVAINSPAPIAVDVDNFTSTIFLLVNGQYKEVGATSPTGKITIVPGSNVFSIYPTLELSKLNPLAGSSNIFQASLNLLTNANALYDIKVDTTVTIAGFTAIQTSTKQFFWSDFVSAISGRSLGLVPNGKRTVKSIPEKYLSMVPKPNGKNEVVKESNADPVTDTVPMIIRNVKRQLWQGKKLAEALKKSTTYDTVKNDWQFVFDHIQYVEDPEGEETVRSLRRAFWEKKSDCDCYVSFLSNLLKNQGIAHKIRITKYNGSNDYTHVYIIVPTGSNYITLDPVVHKFNYEVPFTGNPKDFTV